MPYLLWTAHFSKQSGPFHFKPNTYPFSEIVFKTSWTFLKLKYTYLNSKWTHGNSLQRLENVHLNFQLLVIIDFLETHAYNNAPFATLLEESRNYYPLPKSMFLGLLYKAGSFPIWHTERLRRLLLQLIAMLIWLTVQMLLTYKIETVKPITIKNTEFLAIAGRRLLNCQ